MTTQPKYDTESLWQKDRDHYIHPWTDFSTFKEEGSMVMANSEGAYVIDSDGKRYIDGIGGLWCNNIGYANEEMAEAIADSLLLSIWSPDDAARRRIGSQAGQTDARTA